MARRVAALVAVAHANLNTGIDDLSVSLLQTRAEKIHRPHLHKSSTGASKEYLFEDDTVKDSGKDSSSKANKPHKHEEQQAANKKHGTHGSDHAVKRPANTEELHVEGQDKHNGEAKEKSLKASPKQDKSTDKVDKSNLEGEPTKKEEKKRTGVWSFFDDLVGKPTASPALNLDIVQDLVAKEKKAEKKDKKSANAVEVIVDEVVESKLGHKKKPKKEKGSTKKNHVGHTSKKGHSEKIDSLNLVMADKENREGEKEKQDYADALALAYFHQSTKKSEPTLVRFKGTELAKHAVHLDEIASEEETNKLAEQDEERKKHSNAKFYAKFASEDEADNLAEQELEKHSNAKYKVKSIGAEKDALAEYHPGWKLYELEGGKEGDTPQTEKKDLTSDLVKHSDKQPHPSAHHHKAQHHKQHTNMVSEAMGVAFGDSNSAQVADELPEEAKLYSSPASAASTQDDTTDEFWAEEAPSEIEKEFTVEGVPMTSVLGTEGQPASQATLTKVRSTKTHTHSGKKIRSAQKDSHNVSDVARGKTVATPSHHLSDEEMCEGVSALDFSAATVSHSNLGGQGPDSGEETLVYSGITNQDGMVVDLVVTATSPYAPRDATKNGLQDDFGVLNLEINSAVDLLFRFMSGGQPVVMNSFYFTFFDLDQGRAHESSEKATIRGFDSYRLSDGTSLDVEELGDSSAIFSSSMRGGKTDNPTSPLSLSHLQRERSVVVSFSAVSEFSVQLSEENYASSQGRNWFFSGPSSIVCEREAKCSTYECPDGYHTRTMAEFLVCAGSRCTTADDKDTCCFEEEEEQEEQGDDSEEEGELFSKSSVRADKKVQGQGKLKRINTDPRVY